MNLSKRTPYRNPKLLAAAKDQPCMVNGPFCNHDPSTTVFAHLNESWAGKGYSQKADDFAGFMSCSTCHVWYDSNKIPVPDQWIITRAMYRTWRNLLDREIIK